MQHNISYLLSVRKDSLQRTYDTSMLSWTSDIFNPFTDEFSNALHNASEKAFYQITHMIYLLETIYKIVPYRLGKPKIFLD